MIGGIGGDSGGSSFLAKLEAEKQQQAEEAEGTEEMGEGEEMGDEGYGDASEMAEDVTG